MFLKITVLEVVDVDVGVDLDVDADFVGCSVDAAGSLPVSMFDLLRMCVDLFACRLDSSVIFFWGWESSGVDLVDSFAEEEVLDAFVVIV